MPDQRAERKLILGIGTIGLIFAVVGAAWDYWIDGKFVHYSHTAPVNLGVYFDQKPFFNLWSFSNASL